MTIVQRDKVHMEQWITNRQYLCGNYKNCTNNILNFWNFV